MVNAIKSSGDGVALQVTRAVRRAGLVEEDPPDDPGEDESPPYPTYRASVRVYAFDGVLLVVDADPDRFAPRHVAELVASCARDTASIYRGIAATVKVSGHGYQCQLPTAADAGFALGDDAVADAVPNLLVVTRPDREETRLVEALATIRREQLA
jgi:hypothetical protein